MGIKCISLHSKVLNISRLRAVNAGLYPWLLAAVAFHLEPVAAWDRRRQHGVTKWIASLGRTAEGSGRSIRAHLYRRVCEARKPAF